MELSKSVLRFILGVGLTILGFIASHNLIFAKTPLLGIPYFGQTLVGFTLGAFGLIVLPSLSASILRWFENIIYKTAVEAVTGLIDQQSKKFAEYREIKRKRDEDYLAKQQDKRQRQEEVKLAQKQKLEQAANEKFNFWFNAVLLDTSAIIDGRILDVIKSGFLDAHLVVPKAVIDELHLISDSSDVLKRQRGRRGLDLLSEMQKVAKVSILEGEDHKKFASSGVDKLLVYLAKNHKAKLATVDFNLNKVASLSGIKVLNVNELSNAIKAVALPGELLSLKVIQKGKDQTQGVGYLADGTMIVIEEGADLVGKEASVTISRIIQTPAGKMLFAKKSF